MIDEKLVGPSTRSFVPFEEQFQLFYAATPTKSLREAKMAKLVTVGSVSINGKTFYFNEGKAKSGVRYLAINARSGDRREQVVVFENQMAAFMQELTAVYKRLFGEEPVPGAALPCEECHRLEGGVFLPMIGTGAPDELCEACGRQL